MGEATIRTSIRAISLLRQHRCARVHCLDERALSSLPHEGDFSWFICPTRPIMTHNILHLSFALFVSNQWRWFRSHRKKPFLLLCRLIVPSSPSSGLIRLVMSTVSTVPLSEACENGHKCHQQWCTKAWIH